MQPSNAFDCSMRAISVRIALLYPIVLIRILWVRRNPGIIGTCMVPWSFLKCCIGIVMAFYYIGHRAWIVFSLHAFMRWVDDTIDGDWPMPQGMTINAYLEQKDCLFRDLSQNNSRIQLRPEDIFLVCIVREGIRCGFNFTPQLQSMWHWYRADVERQLQKQFPSSLDILDCPAAKANIEFFMVFFSIMGGTPSSNRGVIEEAVTIFMTGDVLYDLVDDLRKGIAWLPTESLEAHQVPVAQVLTCDTWEKLSAVSGITEWYTHEASRVRQRWDDLRVQLPQEMELLLPDPRVRRLFIGAVTTQFEFFAHQCEVRASLLANPC